MCAAANESFTEYRNDARPHRSDLLACPVETTAQLIGGKW